MRWLSTGTPKGAEGVTISARAELPVLVTTVGANAPFRAFPSPFEAPFGAPLSGSTMPITVVSVRNQAYVGLQTQMRWLYLDWDSEGGPRRSRMRRPARRSVRRYVAS
jgi:hypothetical protein